MSFSLSVGTITQSGTDANLSGLNGITGVTTEVLGGVTKYSLDTSTTLSISGTLTIDPRDNFIEVLKDGNSTLKIESSGNLTLGEDTSYTYGNQLTNGLAIRMIGRSSAPWTSNIQNEGSLTWYGATIDSAGAISTVSGATTTIRSGFFISRPTQNGVPQGNQIYFDGGICDIDGLYKTITGTQTFDNASVGFIAATTIINLKNVVSTGSVSTDNRSSTLGAVPFATVTGFGNLQQGICDPTTTITYLVDCGGLYQRNPTLKRRNAYGTVTRQGQLEAYKTCSGLISYQGVGVLGAKVYWKDIDNSNRGVTAATEWARTYNGFKTYATTSNNSGLFSLSILEAAWYVRDALANQNVGDVLPDKRLEVGDIITAKVFTYLYTPTSLEFKGDSIGSSSVSSPQGVDASLTQKNKATVDAYTSINTSVELYDKAKAFLFDNFAGESSPLVSRGGIEINAGAFNVNIDATAASVFVFDGTTITIKASTYTGNMITTGVISLLNGATFAGTRIDANGPIEPDSVITLTGLENATEVRIFEAGTITEISGQESVTSGTFTTTVAVDFVDIAIVSLAFNIIRLKNIETTSNITIPIQQQFDRNYRNP
jgi:hypothetical protein